MDRWRRLAFGPKHGMARGVAVYGAGQNDAGRLDELLGRCERLRASARVKGLELTGAPEDLGLLDQAIGRATAESDNRWLAAVGNQAGLYLGTVIIASVPGARWRLWPNGHPVVRLAEGRDLDVVALANDLVSSGAPLLADVYADVAGHLR